VCSDKHVRNDAYSQLLAKCKELLPGSDYYFVVKKIADAAGCILLGGNSRKC
jgi:hypothetical protein